MEMRAQIKIQLLSDLCPASGESLVGVVDNEIHFDDYGIPYIPAKRIKGCLREGALEIKDLLGDEFNEIAFHNLFGKIGSDKGGALGLSDGLIASYKDIINVISKGAKDVKYQRFFKKQYIKDYFTSTRTQTQINSSTGSAQKDTLRVSRVINKGTCFYFNIKVSGEEEIELLEKCCKVVRRIGLNRTRGLGEVKCQLRIYDRSSYPQKQEILLEHQEIDVLEYVLQLESQVIISTKGSKNNRTDDYIPGSTMLGYFANRYIKEKKGLTKDNAHHDSTFNNLFINGDISFSNAYITEKNRDGKYIDYVPCPTSIVRLKNEEQYFNEAEKDYPLMEKTKKVEGSYINLKSNGAFFLKKAQTELVYHHQRPRDRSVGHAIGTKAGNVGQGEFYQYHAIKKGEQFKGRITGTKEQLLELIDLIPEDNIITIGRSKTAQYAQAKIINKRLTSTLLKEDKKTITQNQSFTVHLLSPMILVNEYGYYVPDIEILKQKLQKLIGVIKVDKRFLKFKTISGFNTKWMLPKPNILALDAGSVIRFTYLDVDEVNLIHLENQSFGLRCNEGFGMIKILIEGAYELEKEEERNKVHLDIDDFPKEVEEMLERSFSTILKQQIKEKAIEDQSKQKNKEISNSFINKLYFLLLASNTIEAFIRTMYQLFLKKTQTKKVEKALELLFNTTLKKNIYDIFDENKDNSVEELVFEQQKKLQIYNKMLIEIIGQCEVIKSNSIISIKREKNFVNLIDRIHKDPDVYLKEYYITRIQYLRFEGRKGEK